MADRELKFEVTVAASTAQVFSDWTTVAGVKSFFVKDAKIELREGGAYEMYFLLDAEAGQRGSEGCTIIEYEENRSLSFTWNFPPILPDIRHEHTRVDVSFAEHESGKTQVRLSQTGWQDGPSWDAGYSYFEEAWAWVLNNQKEKYEKLETQQN